MKNYFKITILFLISSVVWGQTPKVYDPMDVFRQNIPANIMISVDNSGSMGRDVNGTSIYDFPTWSTIENGYSRPVAGDFYHCNFSGVSNTRDPNPSQWQYKSENFEKTLTTIPQSVTINVSSAEETDFVCLAVDVWMPSWMDREDSSVKIVLSHNGVSKTITPSVQWYLVRKSDGRLGDYNSYYKEEKKFGSTYYLRYRIKYTFKEFYEMDKNGDWNISVYKEGGYSYKFTDAYLHFSPMLAKVTILKTVLQRLFEKTNNVRLSLGMYGSRWSYTSSGIFDCDGKPQSGYKYRWVVNGGYKHMVDWPTNPLATETNKSELMDWVDFDANSNTYFDSNGELGSPDYTREIFASGGTPIGTCMDKIGDFITDAIPNDPSEECRNYAVIFLTDGKCTSGTCTDSYVTGRINRIYNTHSTTNQGGETIGTKVYIIGFALSLSTLNKYAEAGHTDADGNPDNGYQAYTPNNSKELMEAFEDAIADAGEMTFTGDTQLIPIQLDPDKQAKVDENSDPYLFPGEENQENALIQSFFTFSIGNDFGTSNISFKGHLRAYDILKDDYSLMDNGTYRPLWDVTTYTETIRDKDGVVIQENGEDKKVIRQGTISQRIENIKPLLTPDPTKGNNLGNINTQVEFRKSFRCIITPDKVSGSVSIVYLNNYSYNNSLNRYMPNTVGFVKTRLAFTTDAETVKFLDFLQTLPMGDITSSTPAIVGPPDSFYTDETYLQFTETYANRQKVIYVGANDGMLHCLDAHTGDELWAYIPYDIFPKLRELYEQGQPDPMGNLDPIGRKPHLYFMASSPRYSDIKTGTNSWRTVLTIGRGGGGNSYTTLNITNPTINGLNSASFFNATEENNPSTIALGYHLINDSNFFMWNTFGMSNYDNMGETWSVPAFVRIGDQDFIGYFGSGYDPTLSGKGNYLYAIDLYDGESIHSPMQIPTSDSEAVIMGSPGAMLGASGEFFSVYFGDTKGGVYRYIPNLDNFANSTLDKIFQASAATSHNSSILSTPSAFLNAQGEVWLTFGTIGNESSTNVVEDSVLYTLKDPGYGNHDTTLTDSDLVNLKTAITNLNTLYDTEDILDTNGDGEVDKDGHYYPLDDRESIFTSTITTGYNLNSSNKFYLSSLFLTFQYPAQGNYCTLGSTYIYIFGMTNLFIADEDSTQDGKSYIGEGKPGAPFESSMGDIWVNTQSGPMRFTNTQGEGVQMGSGALPVDPTMLGKDGGWYTK